MHSATIQELGDGAFSAKVNPIIRDRVADQYLVGFDTEYTSRSHELLSIQLASPLGTQFIETGTMTPEVLGRSLKPIIPPEITHVCLLAYWSIAELQFIDIYEHAIEVIAYGNSTDFIFYSERHDLLIRVFDIARFFDRQSLSKVAASFGLQKLDYDTSSVTRRSLRSKRFREYAIHDAQLCLDIVAALRRGFDSWEVDPIYEGTPASCASTAFRAQLQRPIEPPAPRVRLCGMRACWGGRAEAFSRGAVGIVSEYDIVSAYPSAAASFPALPVAGSWKPFDRMSETAPFLGGMARVRFEFPSDASYPCLPIAAYDCLLYPLSGESYCTLDELRLAEEMGAWIHVVEGWGFSSGDSQFPKWMQRLLSMRAHEKDPVQRTALKLLANSCIGKLAQRVCDVDPTELLELARRTGIEPLGRMTREEYQALGVNFRTRLGSLWYPEWNGLITGRVRAVLGSAIAETRAHYSATDAVWSSRIRKPRNRLGLCWERKRRGKAVVARTRLAMMDDHIAHHSIWCRSVGKALLENLSESAITYAVEKPRKYKEAVTNRERYGEWRKLIRTGSSRWDHKRKLLPGGSTSPWSSEEAYSEARRADSASYRRRGYD